MKTSFTVCSGILMVAFAVMGFSQQTTTLDQGKDKSEGTVDADRDRAGKTGHIGDGDRGGPGKTGYVGSNTVGGFELRQWDLDKDGRISKTEFERAFNRIDTNHDGYLSSQEFQQAASGNTKSTGNSSSRSSDRERKSDRNRGGLD
jgi:hypothetical protein